MSSDGEERAVAPSVSPAELPAVTRPPARNAGFSAASPSSVVSGRRNSSRSATFQPSSVKTAIGTTVSRMTPFSQAAAARCCDATRERVGALLRDRGEAVVQVLGGLAHRRGRLVDQPLRDEARVEVDVLAHRVVAHVLDTAGERDVDGAERDLAGGRGDGGERAGAHAVDREAGHGLGDAGEERDVAAEGQALVADLRGRGEHDVADPLGLDRRVAAQQLAHGLDAHVVGARAPEWPFGPALPNGVRTPSTKKTSCSSRIAATIAAVDWPVNLRGCSLRRGR